MLDPQAGLFIPLKSSASLIPVVLVVWYSVIEISNLTKMGATMNSISSLAILGAGNIGTAIARGLVKAGLLERDKITLTRRHADKLEDLIAEGFAATTDNHAAVAANDLVILAVEPGQLNGLLKTICPALIPARHTLVSVVSGASIEDIRSLAKGGAAVVRAMPNTAIAVGESMTCLCSVPRDQAGLKLAERVFNTVGSTLVIDEEQMSAATALCACGTAFFLRAIRAASQGGIEIGFPSQDALAMAAQTAKGSAALLLERGLHPEREIDRVTTPRGATISGLNEMEHHGFSSALIKGITTSAQKVEGLYK